MRAGGRGMPGLAGLALAGAEGAARAEPPGWRRWRRRAALAARVAGLQLAELAATAPYGVRAFCVHRGLWRGRRGRAWSVVRGCPYGPDARQFVDVYVPLDGEEAALEKRRPVAVFCHGGAWAAGEAWHYSCLGASLAAEGAVAVVPAYRLYPEANPGEQARDLGRALSWALDNVGERFGGDSTNVTLLGHSSGAHLAALELLRRARVPMGAKLESSMGGSSLRDYRQPKRFVGIAGPYDPERHFHHEAGRGVESLSPMARAMAPDGLGAFSPARVLRDYLGEPSSSHTPPPGPKLEGDAHAWVACAGSIRGAGTLQAKSLEQLLPECFVVSGLIDQSVPWSWGGDFHGLLTRSGARSRKLVYRETGHNDFVTNWGRGLGGESAYVRDMLSIALGRV